MKRFAITMIPAALLLAACEEAAEEEAETAEEGGSAQGDILGGTISDDMLPLEELQSQSPPARRGEGGDEEGEEGDDE